MNVHFMKSRTLFRHSLSTNGNRLMAIVVQRNHQYYYGSNMDSCIYQRTIHSSIGNIPRSFAVNTMPIIRRPLHSSAAVNRWLFPLLSCHHLEQKSKSWLMYDNTPIQYCFCWKSNLEHAIAYQFPLMYNSSALWACNVE